MNARTYNLDPNAAKSANSGGKRITEAGRFTGVISQAWHETNDNGTEAFVFSFKADNGQEAGPISLYTHNRAGEALPSFDTLCSLMACLRLRSLAPAPGRVTVYDYDNQQDVTKQKDVYQPLFGKRIGVLFRQEEYTKRRGQQAGEKGTRLIVHGFFDPATHLMAAEILDQQKEAKQYERELAYVEANPVKPERNSGGQRGGYGGQQPPHMGTPPMADDFADDDIPFD